MFAGHALDGEALVGIPWSERVPIPDEVEGRRKFDPEKTLCCMGDTETEFEVDAWLRVLPYRASCAKEARSSGD